MRLILLTLLLSSCGAYIVYPNSGISHEYEDRSFHVHTPQIQVYLLEGLLFDYEYVAQETGLNSNELKGIRYGSRATPYQLEKLGMSDFVYTDKTPVYQLEEY